MSIMWHESEHAEQQQATEVRKLAAFSFDEIVQLADIYGLDKVATEAALQREADLRIRDALNGRIAPTHVPFAVKDFSARHYRDIAEALGASEQEADEVIRAEVARRSELLAPDAGSVSLSAYEKDRTAERTTAIRQALASLSLTPELAEVPTGELAGAMLLLERTRYGLIQPEVISLLEEDDRISVAYYSRLESGERESAPYMYKFMCLMEDGAYEAAAQRKKATVGSKPEDNDSEQS